MVDVTSLYTVIPHDLGIFTLAWFLSTYSSCPLDLHRFLITAVLYLLKHIFILFDNQFYLQTTGGKIWGSDSPHL